NGLRQKLVDAVCGEPVEPESKGRGYEVGEYQFLVVQDEELETARQVARTLPFSAAPATTPTAREDTASTERAGEKSASLAGRAAPASARSSTAPAIQPPQGPVPPPVRVENTRMIEVERFVPRAQIDPVYFDTPYFITPRDQVGQ